MKKFFLTLLIFLTSLPCLVAQQQYGEELGRPGILKNARTDALLREHGYVSTRPHKTLRTFSPIPSKSGYAFMMDNSTSMANMGMIDFPLNNPAGLHVFSHYPGGSTMIYNGLYVEDTYYGFLVEVSASGFAFPQSLVKIDLETGATEEVCSLTHIDPESVFNDMTYDYSTGTAYGVMSSGTFRSDLYTFSLEDGSMERVCTLSGTYIMAIACTYEGQMYGIGTGGGLYLIDKTTGQLTEVGNTGYMPWYLQSMEFDHTDNVLYWTGADAEHTFFAQVDTTDASTLEIGTFAGTCNVVGLHIPFTRVQQGAPAQVSDFRVTAGQKGEHYADVRWTNPTHDPFGNALSGTVGVRVYRDGELTADVRNGQPGEAGEYTDRGITETGEYEYRVVPYNEVGNGESVRQRVWIGEDYPTAPDSVWLETDNGKVNIGWRVPEVGIHGGWVNHERLVSSVYREQDNHMVADAVSGFHASDTQVQTLGRWSYRVVVRDLEGNTAESRSDTIIAGPALSLPYSQDFSTDEEFNLWTVLNMNNDNAVWNHTNFPYDNGARYVQYRTSYADAADDALIAPPVKMYAGHEYRVSFDVSINRMLLLTEEKLAVFASKSPTANADVETIEEFTVSCDNTTWSRREFFYTPRTDGDYYIGIYIYSDADKNWVNIDNFLLEERFYYDLEAVALSGPNSALINRNSTYQATVRNKGARDASSFTLCLVDADGQKLTDDIRVDETLAAGESGTYDIVWNPNEVKDCEVYLSVTLPNDGYTDNNRTSQPLVVSVRSSDNYEVTLGEATGWLDVNPFFPPSENACSTQSLYLSSEINGTSGVIRKLTWYTHGIEILPFTAPVKIYLGNTDLESLSDGMVDVSQLTLVYDGEVYVADSEQTAVEFELDNRFAYSGSNLIIHIERGESGRNFGWSNGFQVYQRASDVVDTRYNTGVREVQIAYKPVVTVNLNAVGNSLSGDITDNEGNALESVALTIEETGMTTTSDADGHYEFGIMNEGTYTLTASLLGYEPYTGTVTMGDAAVVHDLVMERMPTVDYTVTVNDFNGNPISGVAVGLDGYQQRSATTGSDGVARFDALICDTYGVTVEDVDYQTVDTVLTVSGTEASAELTLLVNAYPVDQFGIDTETYTLTWTTPVRLREMRYDDGNLTSRAGSSPDENVAKAVFGINVEETGLVKSLSWYLADDSGDAEATRMINLYIFYLDENGMPQTEPVHVEEGIRSAVNGWYEYRLQTPFEAVQPFFIGLSASSEYLGLGVDGSNSEDSDYTWRPAEQYYSDNYENGFYRSDLWTGGHLYRGNFMIRVSLSDSDSSTLPTAAMLEGYNVYRFLSADRTDSSRWTKIAETMATSYTDTDMESMPQGYYQYAVTAAWVGSGESTATLTEVIDKDMQTSVHIVLAPNVEGSDVLDGTEISLVSADGRYTYNGRLEDDSREYVFDGVSKNTYVLDISHPRFSPIDMTIEPNQEDTYIYNIDMTERLTEPLNLQAEETAEGSGEYALSWNWTSSIFDDFEGHEDFALNSPGTIGWTYLNNDSQTSTYGFSADNARVEYDNWGAATAYIVFNPSQTRPRLDVSPDLNAWSGTKYLGSFSSSEAANDDWIISPELVFDYDFSFMFYARSYTTIYGADRMMVGYSLTDNSADSFVWLTGSEPVELDVMWQQYAYTVPAEARYVAIRCVSDDSFFFMLDDIQIGENEPTAIQTYALRYEVYVDGDKVGETQEPEMTVLTGDGRHTIGVKAIYESGESVMATIDVDNDNSGISRVGSGSVFYHDRRLQFDGVADRVVVYSMTGSVVAGASHAEGSVDLSGLQSGVYVAVVELDGGQQVIKFIIR